MSNHNDPAHLVSPPASKDDLYLAMREEDWPEDVDEWSDRPAELSMSERLYDPYDFTGKCEKDRRLIMDWTEKIEAQWESVNTKRKEILLRIRSIDPALRAKLLAERDFLMEKELWDERRELMRMIWDTRIKASHDPQAAQAEAWVIQLDIKGWQEYWADYLSRGGT